MTTTAVVLDLTPFADLPTSDLLDRLRAEIQKRTDLEAELARERQIVADLAEEVDRPPLCEGSRGGEKFCGHCPGCVFLSASEAEAQRLRADALALAGEQLSQRVDDLETAAEGLHVQLETVTTREAETVAQLRSQIAQLEQALEVATDEARAAALERAEAHPIQVEA